MDSDSLYYSLDLVSGCGHTVSLEKRAALQTSLVILKKNYKFRRVMFWGKILTLKNDYFIAQGRGDDEMNDRKYLYSFNCIDWYLLPSITDSMVEEVDTAAAGRFIGDPSYVYEHFELVGEVEGEEDEREQVVTKVNEERRLAVTVNKIDVEVSVVPRGAFIKTSHGFVQMNRSFGGLSTSETSKLNNFLHFTEQKNLKKKSILEMADLNPCIDFMDALSDDIPKGSWSLQFESASKVCVIRSLLWLGLSFYHVPMTPQHGYIYVGDGTKNLDLPFML